MMSRTFMTLLAVSADTGAGWLPWIVILWHHAFAYCLQVMKLCFVYTDARCQCRAAVVWKIVHDIAAGAASL